MNETSWPHALTATHDDGKGQAIEPIRSGLIRRRRGRRHIDHQLDSLPILQSILDTQRSPRPKRDSVTEDGVKQVAFFPRWKSGKQEVPVLINALVETVSNVVGERRLVAVYSGEHRLARSIVLIDVGQSCPHTRERISGSRPRGRVERDPLSEPVRRAGLKERRPVRKVPIHGGACHAGSLGDRHDRRSSWPHSPVQGDRGLNYPQASVVNLLGARAQPVGARPLAGST